MATNQVFCSIPTQEFKERAEQVKKKYPNLLDGNIEAIINCCSLGLTNGKRGSIPTMSQIEDYMKGRRIADFNVTEEEQDIMNRAIENGTFMKAPNGEDTKLTVKQWLQVRTKAFKDWFGDWETWAKIKNAKVIWGHPGTGKTWLFKQGRKDIIDFDSEYKSKLGNLEEREILKKKLGKDAYNKKLDKLFDQAIEEAEKSGRKLLVSDMHFLRDKSDLLDVITNISDTEFIERSHQRGEHDETNKQDWKNSINKALTNVSSDKIINATGYISDLLDGTNVSKVIDENGEPLIVYRGANEKEEGKLTSRLNGYYFTASKYMADDYAKRSGGITDSFFLNIRNLKTWSSEFATVKRKDGSTDSVRGLFQMLWDKSNIEDLLGNSDGALWEYPNEYLIINLNQAKSATDNSGEFSTENDDIRYNRQPKTPIDVLIEQQLIDNWASKNGEYYINGRNETALANFEKIKKALLENNFNIFVDKKLVNISKGRYKLIIGDVADFDKIKRETKKDLTSIHSAIKFLEDKIPTLQGHIHEVSVKEANERLNGKLKSNETAFIQNGEIFLIKGRVTRDAAIEEGLHALTLCMEITNPELYKNLVKEAKSAFPTLLEEIKREYDKEDVDNEIITQGLTRVFRNGFDTIPVENRKTVKDFVTKFIDWFNNAVNRFLKSKYTGRELVELNKLPVITKLSDLADLLLAPDSEFGITMPIKDKTVFNRTPQSYEGKITSDENTIFVFGSNPEGRHGAGAAKIAREQFGAIYGQGEGLQGNAYALPTKDLRVKKNNSLKSISPEQITENIKRMYKVAQQTPNKQFKVAYTNGLNEATLNGYTGAEMIKMFKDAGPIPSNVIFSKNWTDHWDEIQSNGVSQQQAKEQIQNVNTQKYVDQSQLDEQVASVFTSQQREDRVNMLAKLFSRTVDALIARNAEQVKDRKAFVVANSQRVFDTMKAWLNPERAGLTDYQKQEFKKISDNFQALIQQASDKIVVNEGVAFDFILNEANGINSQDLGNTDNDNTDPETSASALKDGWMIKARQLDLRETLSAETRRILNNIVRVRPDGKIDVDDLGIERYIDPDYAHLTILEEVSKITKSSEFNAAIERLVNKHPWMRLVQQEFEKDPSIKAKFYQDMKKELVPYWMNRNGKTKQVNIKPSTLYMFQNWQMNELAENRLDDDSIWDATGAPSKVAAEKGAKLVDSIETQLNDKGEEAVVKDNIKTLQKIARMLGIGVSDSTLEDALLNVVDSTKNDEPIYGIEQFLNSARTIFSGINDEKFNIGAELITDYFKSAYYKIADVLNDLPEGVTIASFRENGKNYTSYTNPSYLGKMLMSIKGKNWQAYMEKEFGRFKHFRKNGVYRIDMLRKLTSPLEGKKYRAMLDRKVVLHYNGQEFDDWTPKMYLREMMDEFYSDPSKEGGDKWAWYYLPLLSDAPSAEYIKFVRYTDEPNTSGSVEEKIIPKLGDIVRQEIDRINTVLARKKRIDAGEIQPIANYDIVVDKDGKTKLNGAKFYFFPRLNSYVDPNTGRTFLQEYVARQQVNQSDADLYLDSVISEDVKAGYNQFIQENGLKDESRSREFYYNNALMYAQTVELTTTDLAYYKNLNDFQKRFKEVYAMTQRLYLESPLGKPSQNVVYLKDIKIISKLYDAVKDIFDKALREGKIDKVTHDYVLSQYKKINIADAQGIRSLESYRSILDSCGKWTDKMETAYQNITSGKFDIADFNVLYETLKPFTFTQTAVDSGTNEGLIKVPVHHKDSEFVLLSIYQAIAQNMAPSPMMKAIGDLFDGKFSPKGEKIDMVLFESGVKAGLQGPIDLSGERLGYDDYAKRFRKGITRKINGKLEINPEVVHTIDMEDYGIQVVSSEHLIDHFEIIGTQFRRLIDSDIPEGTVFTIRGKQFTKKELHDLYQSILTENVLDSFEDVRAIFDDTEKLADRLQREMAQSGRYTDEERKAATLIEGTTDFNIPLYDPIQSRRMEQALNAIIKKNITKQTMRRGLCPQVSSVGFTDELQVRLRDEQGNLIFNENEWNDVEKAKSGMSYENYKRLKALRKQFNTFEDYRKTVKGNSVGYWEVYLPAYMKSLYLNYVDDEGKLDMSRIPEDMRRLIGFRVPTEAKYSMQPMYVKGFLPQQNGSAIMLPAEITATTGSDFDIDKVQLLLPQGFDVADYRKIYDNLSQKERNAWETSGGTQFSVEDEQLFELLGLPEEEVEKQSGFTKWLAYTKENNPEVFKNVEDKRVKYVGYDYTKSVQQNKRYKRNNALIDIAWSVLTNEAVAEQTLGIGGFDELKRLKDIFTIMKMVPFTTIKKELRVAGGFNEVFKALANISQKKAEELAAKYERVLDPLSPTTQMYFHEQNAVGGKMIGIYAVGNAAHAIGEHHRIQLIHELEFFGKKYQKIDATISEEGKLISKALAEFIGASVDNVKDPVLAALMQNTNTGDITNFLVRLGVPAYEAVLLLTCPYVARDKRIQGEVNLTPENVAMAINYRALRDSGEITDEEKAQLDNMANIICSRVSDLRDTVSSLAKELTEETQISRADAMTNAAGPDVASNEFRIHKIELRRDTVEREMNNIESDVLDYDFLFDGNFDKDHIRRECMKSTTPALTAMTKCGVIGTRELLNKYFPHTKPVVANLIHSKEFGLRRYIKLDTLKKEDYINIVEKFYADLYLYLLNGTEFFGNISGLNKTQNFMFTLDNIPALFDEMLKKYPELKSNYFISQLQTVKAFGRTRKIVTKNSNYSKTKKQRMSLDWIQLVTDNNPEIKNLGFMLFKYSTLNGLGFSPYSFVQMVPNVIKRAIPDYIDGIRRLETYDMDNVLRPFVEQFVLNHIRTNTKLSKPIQAVEKVEGDEYFVDESVSAFDVTIRREGRSIEKVTRPALFLSFPVRTVVDGNEAIVIKYLRFDRAEDGQNVYKLVKPLGINNVAKEYYFGQQEYAPAIASQDTQGAKRTEEEAREALDALEQAMYEAEGSDVMFDPETGDYLYGDESVEVIIDDMPEIPEAKDPITGQPICK